MKALIVADGNRSDRHIAPFEEVGVEVVAVCSSQSSVPARLRWMHEVFVQVEEHPDLDVIISSEWGPIGFAAALAARLHGVPYIFRPRGDAWQEYDEFEKAGRRNRHKLLLDRWIAQKLVGWADAVLPVSNSLLETVIERTGCRAEKLEVVRIPVNCSRFKPPADKNAIKRELGYPCECLITLATVFNYEDKIRGVRDHLPLLHAVVEQCPNAEVVIAGAGVLLEDMRERHRDILEHPRVHLPGWVSDMVSLYQASDIVCHFSYFDACPNVLLEAWACEVPVVVNDYAPLLERVIPGENGYVLGADASREELLDLFTRLVTDAHLRATLGRNGREMALTELSVASIGRQLIEAIGSRCNGEL